MKTGIEMIAVERQEQIDKHRRTIERDVHENSRRQLLAAAHELTHPQFSDYRAIQSGAPYGWDRSIWVKMCRKSEIERLVIAGALIAAEIDRLINDAP